MAQTSCTIPDIQSTQDARRIAIDRVGIKDIRHPVFVRDSQGNRHPSVATCSMYVNLPHDRKGTHMSRFVAMLNEGEVEASVPAFHDMLERMTERLEAETGFIEMAFTYFLEKAAPVSGQKSLMDYDVTLVGQTGPEGTEVRVRLTVPVTSLCPCSKEISEYGAHNQRSHIRLEALVDDNLSIEEMIRTIEPEGSCELYGLLKRPDEKHITEKAYENPKFVEDMIRDVAVALDREPRILAYTVETENFESIHNHSAYALIERDKRSAS